MTHDCVSAESVHFHINVQSFGDTNIKYLEVSGRCSECGRKIVFRGPAGLNPAHPTVALNGSEAVFPFLLEGETYDGKASGYSVSSAVAN